LSSRIVPKEPNNDKTVLFGGTSKLSKRRKDKAESSIRGHIRQLNEQMKDRLITRESKKGGSLKNSTNKASLPKSFSQSDLKAIAGKFSKPSLLLSNHSNSGELPKIAMLKPKLPDVDCVADDENKMLELDETSPRTHLHKTKPKNLWFDRSLPCIEDELNATRIRLQRNLESKESFDDEEEVLEEAVKQRDDTSSGLKKSFMEIIASKVKKYKSSDPSDVTKETNEDENFAIEAESTSSLSSAGTYFTNDSGSVLMMGEQTIPMQNLKAEKAFKVRRASRLLLQLNQATAFLFLSSLQNRSLVTMKEVPVVEPNPYFIPTVEQYEMVKEMSKPKDRFHTHRTRSCANIRDRIKVEVDEYDGGFQFATDFDESYQSEFYAERSHMTYCFKPRSEIEKLRATFRKKLDIYWIKERIVKGEIEAQVFDDTIESLKTQANDYETFLTSHQEKTFRATNRVMQEVKAHYQTSDALRKQHETLQMQIEPLKMSIFHLGNEFVKRTVIQNFQYLMKPIGWRLQHDFIHTNLDGELESIRDSIEQRNVKNIWNRADVGVFTIRNFIENVFLKEIPRPVPIFEDGRGFLEAYKELQTKSRQALVHYQMNAQILADVTKEFLNLIETNTKIIEKFETIIGNVNQRKVFMEKRSKDIRRLTLNLIDEPLEQSLKSPTLRTTQALIDLMYKKTLSKVAEEGTSSSSSCLSHSQKVSQLETKLFNVLDRLGQIPVEFLKEAEEEARRNRMKKWHHAKKAYRIDVELKQRMDQFKRLFEKTKKPKREGKLPMSVIPKKPEKPKPKLSILTPLEKEYARAFNDCGVDGEVKFDENAKKMVEKIRNQSIPFYIDHYLEKHGLKINKDSRKTIDEIMDEEEEFIRFKDVLPQVRQRTKLQATINERIKQENIRKTSYLYES
jgi:hypothetical protein